MTAPRFNPFMFPQWLRPHPYGPQAPGYDPRQAPQGAPVAPEWYQGLAPAVPEPTAAYESPGRPPEGLPVDWQAAGAKPRPLVQDWRPPEEELSRWGVERVVDVAVGVDQPAQELTRVTLPIPGGCVVMVYVSRLTPLVNYPGIEFQVLAGIGSVNVAVTEWTPVPGAMQDGIARVLAPQVIPPASGAPPASIQLEARFPAKWVSVNYRIDQPPDVARLMVGCIVSPVQSMF